MTGPAGAPGDPANSAALASFWDISTRRAQAMVFLSRRMRIGEPDVAHTFGLFCDTGVPLLMDRFADYAATYAAASLEAERPFTALEDERHSTSHAAIGCLLARNWGLSDGRRPGPSCTTTTTRCWTTRPRRAGALAGGAVAAGRKRDLQATRATPNRWNGTRAARAPAPISACRRRNRRAARRTARSLPHRTITIRTTAEYA
jgi:hypothetical protein